jgi:hypothetical protein
VERSSVKYAPYAVTHMAFVKRIQQQQQQPPKDNRENAEKNKGRRKKNFSSITSKLLKGVCKVYVKN